jgi:hypothetical protein
MTTGAAPLLVPIAVEALVVNHVEQSEVTFHRWELEYSNLKQFLSPSPLPFSDLANTPPAPGLHLHWGLPRGLTRGEQVQARATAEVSGGQLTAVKVSTGGYGYSNQLPPMVMVTGGEGSGALATAVVAGGVVTGVTINNPGSGYASAPQITIAPSPSLSFPLVPNRWLVVRYSPAPLPSALRPTMAWLLQSDSLDANADVLESNSFVRPFPQQPGTIEPTRLGTKATVLASWAGESGDPQKLFLRALGPGNATFAAYQPGVVNVFSFYDPIDDPHATSPDPKYPKDAAQFPENTSLSYLVVGWYSDPAHDPLYGPVTGWDEHGYPVRTPWSGTGQPPEAWEKLLSALDWTVNGAEAQPIYPSQTLYHGSVYGVNWQTTLLPPNAKQSTANMTVAVGHTSIDALSAIVQWYADNPQQGQLEAEMLEAFQYDLLTTLNAPDGEAQLELKIRDAWFGSVPGGTVWQVAAAQTGQFDTGQLTPGTVPPPPRLKAEQATALALLNRNQRALDEARQFLYSQQRELYGAWWKANRLATMSFSERLNISQYLSNGEQELQDIQGLLTKNLALDNPSGLLAQVVQQQKTVTQQAEALPDATNAQSILNYATKAIGLDPAQLQLKPVPAARYYHPPDPVLLVSGIDTSAKQGTLDGGSVFCRFIGQTVTGVNVAGRAEPVTAATGGLGQTIPAPTNSRLPVAVSTGLAALSVETFFVDQANAATICAVGLNSNDQNAIQQLAAAMLACTAQVAAIPSPLGAKFAYANWNGQPWSPLYLEWDVTFYPTVQASKLHSDRDNWAFNPVVMANPPAIAQQPCWSFDGTEYDWYGGLPSFSRSYIGRTFLTPQATYILISKLRKYLKDNPNANLQAVENLLDRIGEWKFLSQRLSGLVDQWVMRDIGQSPLPDQTVAQQIGEEFRATPDPSNGDQDLDFGSGTPFFFPVYGGFLKFNQLIVVDSFGQVVDLMQAGGNIGTGVPWAPVRGRGLSPLKNTQLPQPSELISLAPQLAQGGRLNLRFFSATDDSQETNLWPDANPVCGWVLPNHLDGGLAVYDASGNAVGELLLLIDTTGTRSVCWLPAPDSAAAISDPCHPPNTANTHLCKFVCSLMGTKDEGRSLSSLLQVIDETLWTIDPLGSRADTNLSILIGRPLALVRAGVQIETAGSPVYNQSWADTLQKKTAGIETLQFPVRLGSLQLYDDGLLGYFAGDTYTAFNSVHTPANFQSGGYLNPIGYNGNYLSLPLNYPDFTTQYVTLLLDPRGDVHAFSALFPALTISLPPEYFVEALPRLSVTFRTGPVLAEAGEMRLPYPTEKNGTWSWIQRTDPTPPLDWTDPSGWQIDNIVKANQQARFPSTTPHLREGWLKLTPKDIEH